MSLSEFFTASLINSGEQPKAKSRFFNNALVSIA